MENEKEKFYLRFFLKSGKISEIIFDEKKRRNEMFVELQNLISDNFCDKYNDFLFIGESFFVNIKEISMVTRGVL